MGNCKSCAKRKAHSNTDIPQETRKKSNKYANYTPKATIKEEMKNSRLSRRQETLKIRAENKRKRNKRDHSKNQQSQKLVL